jgi:mono/diheme cytochrome c family protein
MKKTFGRIASGLVALLALAVTAAAVKFYALSPRSRPPPAVTAPSTPEAIARGKYLVDHVAGCLACHSPIDETRPGDFTVAGRLGAGRDFGHWEGAPFRVRAPNLTPDPETGIGRFTDGELLRGIREGIGRDGHVLVPLMPYQTYAKTLSDDDALAIIAYLRTLAPIAHDPGRTEVQFPVSMFLRALPAPVEASPPPAPAEKLARGRWLLDVASCHDCHDMVNERMEKLPGKALGGGMPLEAGGKTYLASNISSDPATGIGAYSDEDLRRVLDEGKGKDGHLLYVMPWSVYSGMTQEDKDALIAALREQPPVVNAVPRPSP